MAYVHSTGKCQEYESRMHYQDKSISKLKDQIKNNIVIGGQNIISGTNSVDNDLLVNPFGLMLEELMAPSHREGLSSVDEAKTITRMLQSIEEGLQEVFR